VALLSVGLAACGGDGGNGDGGTPGTLTVVLVTAPSSPGAMMFTISGAKITGVTASGSYHKYETTLSQSSRRVMLTGDIVSGALVTISVPDIGKASSYHVTVNQVAAKATASQPYAQLAAGGFAIDVQ
jgi:hypothetical protein